MPPETGAWADKLTVSAVQLWIGARYFLETRRFRRRMGYGPQAAMPRTFTEKLLWRKIFDRSPLIARLSDKLAAKEHFAKACPDLAQAGIVWVGDSAWSLPDEALRGDVVVKSNCGSGQNLFSFQGQHDGQSIRRQADRWLKRRRPYGRSSIEWGYWRIERKLMVEQLIRDNAGKPPFNVNVHVADGTVLLVHVWRHLSEGAGRFDRDLTAVYDGALNRLDAVPYKRDGTANPTFAEDFQPPKSIHQACEHARRLGRGLDYLRIDFLCTPERAHAGEFTFYTHAGYLRWTDPAIQDTMSAAWDLRKSWFLSEAQPGWRGVYAKALRRMIDREEQPAGQGSAAGRLAPVSKS